jgi:outer membrane autotransporter protein
LNSRLVELIVLNYWGGDMNTGAFKFMDGRCALISNSSALVLMLGLMPLQALATTGDTRFRQYVTDICGGVINPPPGVVWDTAILSQMCTNAAPGFIGSGGAASANVSTSNAGGGLASRKKKSLRDSLDDQKEKPAKGASGDGGRWGLLLTPQYGNSNRTETNLENGYQASLRGLVAGLDYRFSDSFVLGATLGQTKDTATFLNSAGSLETGNNTFNFYGTYIPTEHTSFDAYMGYGKLSLDSNRHVEFGTIIGSASGSASGHQIMGGMSASYQTDAGRFNLAPFINLDYIKTTINSYNESGTTTMELHYGDRSTISFTSSIGARVSASYGYDWGTLQPSARLASVHEFQNKSKQLSNELVSTPGTPFLVVTDSPDRNYLNIGLGVSAALNSGTQLFLDYDKRTQDKLLSSWAVSLGALMEF